MNENSGWQPIATAPRVKAPGPAVLIYSPQLEADPDYPGHAIQVSNPEYAGNGNAKRHGFTHWMPIPSPPTSEESK